MSPSLVLDVDQRTERFGVGDQRRHAEPGPRGPTGASPSNFLTLLGLADRCSNEGGNHGPNHWDWMENFDDDFPTLTADLRDIYNACDINEGGEEPF